MRFGWMIACTLGCGMKDPSADWEDCVDTAAGACDTGHWDDHADHDHDGDEDGGEEGGEESGGEESGGEEGGEETGAETGGDALDGSCDFGNVCIETEAVDPEAWCNDQEGGTPSADACADGYSGTCDVPAGANDDYADAAVVYYYDMDGSTACANVGGTYTDAAAGDDSDDTGW